MLCLSVLSVQLWAQAPSTAANSAGDATTAQSAKTDDLKQLRERIAKQEQEIKKLEQSVEEQRAMLEKAMNQPAAQPATASVPAIGAVSTTAQIVPVVNVARPQMAMQKNETAPSSPLGISIGNTTFTPLGFVDATFFARSTNVGSGIGTNFAGIPYNNSATGHLSETNFSAQNSRAGFRVDSNFKGWKVLGYFEADFLFNNNATSFQIGSNSAGFRLRNYFVDANNGKFEILGGQDWSLLTPNRKGLSPIPGDIFYTQNEDTNYQLGLVWTRAPQFRFIAHPNDHVAVGVALENPQQYIAGGNGSTAVTLPAGLSGIAGQFQANTNSTAVPNLMPDIIAKLALDENPGGRAMHFEVAGVVRGFKDYILPSVGLGTVPGSHTAVGGGGEVNSNIELFKNVKLVENLYFSDGGGRYVFGEAPDFIVHGNGSLSLLHTYSTVDGIEAQVAPKTLLAMYYGGVYVGRNTARDTTATVKAGTPYPLVGYGNTAGTQNRDIQEITFDWIQTLWKSKNYGALSLINQYSYIFREPWAVAAGAPKAAHSNMVWVDLRYTLP